MYKHNIIENTIYIKSNISEIITILQKIQQFYRKHNNIKYRKYNNISENTTIPQKIQQYYRNRNNMTERKQYYRKHNNIKYRKHNILKKQYCRKYNDITENTTLQKS